MFINFTAAMDGQLQVLLQLFSYQFGKCISIYKCPLSTYWSLSQRYPSVELETRDSFVLQKIILHFIMTFSTSPFSKVFFSVQRVLSFVIVLNILFGID